MCVIPTLGTHRGRPGVRLHRARHLEISGTEPHWAHADGEIVGRGKGRGDALRRLTVEVLPGKLTVLA